MGLLKSYYVDMSIMSLLIDIVEKESFLLVIGSIMVIVGIFKDNQILFTKIVWTKI